MASFMRRGAAQLRGLPSLKSTTINPQTVGARFARCIQTQSTRYTLNTGDQIPAIGFGTFQDPDAQEDAVSRALKAGLRLIDTARVYNVEEQVGKGIKASGIPREEIFLGTKLWCNNYHPDDVESALEDSLRDLNTPYVDLLLMHYPCTFKRGEDRFPRDADGKMIHGETNYVDTWKAMQELVKGEKVKAIGVSNFSKGEIETLIAETGVVSLQEEEEEKLVSSKHLHMIFRLPPYIKWRCTHTFNKKLSTNGSRPRVSTSSSSVRSVT
jgi:hypothetical protein